MQFGFCVIGHSACDLVDTVHVHLWLHRVITRGTLRLWIVMGYHGLLLNGGRVLAVWVAPGRAGRICEYKVKRWISLVLISGVTRVASLG